MKYILKKIVKDSKEIKCCICGRPIEGWGNNPWPVENEGECCDICNQNIVLPARIEMMFNKNEMSIPDIWVACQQIMNMMDQLNAMKDDIEIKGSDLELKKLAEENSDVDFENEDNKQAISDFMNLFNKEFSLK